jgi:NTP pyrophosphatase (non-canonical NTP hydrolase)
MSTVSIIDEIQEWQRTNPAFEGGTYKSAILHLACEVGELAQACGVDGQAVHAEVTRGLLKTNRYASEEIADVFIVLCDVARRFGGNLLSMVRAKHEKNLRREWKAPDANGVVEHVEAASPVSVSSAEDLPDPLGRSVFEPKPRPEPKHDPVNRPSHYAIPGISECIDVIDALGFDFHVASAFAYIWRSKRKGSELEDLKKARWYLDRAIRARS